MTILEALKRFDKNAVVSLETEHHGQFWIGKAKFATSNLTFRALNKDVKISGTSIIFLH